MATQNEILEALAKARNAGDDKAVAKLQRAYQQAQVGIEPGSMDAALAQHDPSFALGVPRAVPDPIDAGAMRQLQGKNVNPLEAAWLGVGNWADRLTQGTVAPVSQTLRNALPSSATLLESILPEEASPQEMQKRKDIYQNVAKEHPTATTVGEMVPYFAGYKPWMQAAMGAAEYGTPAERGVRAGLGYGSAKAGQAAGTLLGRVINPVRPVNPELSNILDDISAREKIPLFAEQRNAAGATFPTTMEAITGTLSRIPGSSGTMGTARQVQEEAFNEAINRTLGRTGKDFIGTSTRAVKTEAGQVIPGIADEIGGRMRAAAQGVSPDLGTANVINDLVSIQNNYSKLLKPDEKVLIKNYIDDIPSGRIDAETYLRWRSRLGERAASTKDPDLKTALKDIQGVLDKAFDAAATPAQRAAMNVSRREFENMYTLRPLIEKAGMSTGDIEAKKIAGRVAKESNQQAPIRDLATLGSAIDKPPPSMFLGPYLSMAASATGIPQVLAKTIRNPIVDAYLSHGLLPISPKMSKSLKTAGGILGGASALRSGELPLWLQPRKPTPEELAE